MKAAIYPRQSTQQQAEGTSMDTQTAACLSLGKSLGYEVPPELACPEIWSGADLERPVLSALRELARAGGFDALIVYSPDRLSRDPLHLLTLLNDFAECGVEVHFVLGISDTTPEGQLLMYVQGYAAQKERSQITERTRRGKEAVARSGRLPMGVGRGIYGYDYDPVKKLRIVNEEEAAIVREIFLMASQGVSTYRIALTLNERGVLTKHGHKWRACGVTRILNNSAYIGVNYFGLTRSRKVSGGKRNISKRAKSEAVRIEGFTPPVLSRELLDRAQECLKVRQSKVTTAKRRFLLTGFANCSQCGSPVVGASSSKQHRYCHCNAANWTAMGPGLCQARLIRADDLEEVVWRRICDAIGNPAVLVAELLSHFETGGGDIGEVMSDLKREVQGLKSQQHRLIELRQKDMVDQEILEGQLAPLKALYDEKQQALRVLELQLEQRGGAVDLERRIFELCDSFSETLEGMDFDNRRAVLGTFGVKVTVTREEISIRLVVGPEFSPNTHLSPWRWRRRRP